MTMTDDDTRKSWPQRATSSGWLWCPLVILAAVLIIWDGRAEALLLTLSEKRLVQIGTGVFVTLAVIPFMFPSSLALHRKFELAAILAGGFVAVITAILLVRESQNQRTQLEQTAKQLQHVEAQLEFQRAEIELQQTEMENRKQELQDLKAARITRAWDLLHKAREQAAKRMDAAEQRARDSGDRKLLDALNELQACQARSTAAGNGSTCSTEHNKLAEERWRVRKPARGGNDGQIGAITTLFNAEVDLNGLVVDELYLQRLQLPGKSLEGASFKNADLAGANLTGANLWDADLGGANLWGANLGSANLGSANLTGANLWRADLTGAKLWDANLTGANLTGAKFCKHPKELGAVWPEAYPPRNLDQITIDAKSLICQ